MAIDSALKRRAASGITFPLTPSVTPDSDKDVSWRQTAGWGYPGELEEQLPFTLDVSLVPAYAIAAALTPAYAVAVTLEPED